jgi:hypothetical protein
MNKWMRKIGEKLSRPFLVTIYSFAISGISLILTDFLLSSLLDFRCALFWRRYPKYHRYLLIFLNIGCEYLDRIWHIRLFFIH